MKSYKTFLESNVEKVNEGPGSRNKGKKFELYGQQLRDDFLNSFRFGKGSYEDNTRYDYSKGYVGHHRTVKSEGFINLLSPKISKILEQNKMEGKRVKIYGEYSYYKVISDATPKPAELSLGVKGNDKINLYRSVEIARDTKSYNFSKDFNALKSDIKKLKELPEDILKSLLWSWKPLTSKEVKAGSKSWGIGSGASTTTYTDFNKIYSIKGLDKIWGSKEAFEKAVQNSWSFGKSNSTKNIQFNWKDGIMTTGGTYSQKWD